MISAQAIIEIVAQEAAVDPASLTPETRLKDLSITSLDMMNVSFSIEETCGVLLEADDLDGVETLGGLVALVESKSIATANGGEP